MARLALAFGLPHHVPVTRLCGDYGVNAPPLGPVTIAISATPSSRFCEKPNPRARDVEILMKAKLALLLNEI